MRCHFSVPAAARKGLITAVGVVTGLTAVMVGASPALANPNPINWRVYQSFIGGYRNDVPLRYGQHDHGTEDGFGKYHIEDGHQAVPAHSDIQDAVSNLASCQRNREATRYVCDPGYITVVYSPVFDSRSHDGRPFGIITAFYHLPCVAPTDDTSLKCARSNDTQHDIPNDLVPLSSGS